MSSPTDIIVWPDCTICYQEDLPSMTHMSNDYRTIMDPSPIGREETDAAHLYMYFWSHLEGCAAEPLNFNPHYQGH